MRTVEVTVECGAPPGEVERAWCDTGTWPRWVEGLEEVLERDAAWPGAGAEVRWRSIPAGRGTVRERVVAREPLRSLELEIEDDQVTARQAVRLVPSATGTLLTVSFSYRLRRRSPLTPLVDVLFVRRAMQDWLRGTLDRFAAVAAGGG